MLIHNATPSSAAAAGPPRHVTSANPFTRVLQRFRSDLRGAAAVEFAFIGPVLMMLLLGGVVWGLHLGAAHSIQQLASDAARASVAGLDTAERRTLAEAFVAERAGDYPLVSSKGIVVNVSEAGASAGGAVLVISLAYRPDATYLAGLGQLFAVPPAMLHRSASIRQGGI